MDIKLLLKENAARVEEALSAQMSNDDPDIARLIESMRYSLLAGGKRIRPFLVLAFCRLHGGEDEAAMPFACALEMIHTYSLIHDDLPCMDDDALRRGRPTNHIVYGEATALLAGDALLTRAFEVAASAPGVSATNALAALRTLAALAGINGMIGGQEIDLRGEREVLDFDTLCKLHAMKTGALMRAAAVLGCLAAGLSPDSPAIHDAEAYADGVGLAFQIVDDVLDACGDEATLGKSVGSDAAHKKTTFLRFFGVEEALRYAEKVTEQAIASLADYPEAEALTNLARYLMQRKH